MLLCYLRKSQKSAYSSEAFQRYSGSKILKTDGLCMKLNIQKQPPEVFCKKFCKIHRKTPVPETLFNKVAGFIKKESLAQVFSCEFCEISKNTFFTEHLRTTTSECLCDES